uniref:Uncharacterized protein n=1 Tax=Anguilla anguilla TaxID=7936 RepID=A0A0E9TU85_ANGAN
MPGRLCQSYSQLVNSNGQTSNSTVFTEG